MKSTDPQRPRVSPYERMYGAALALLASEDSDQKASPLAKWAAALLDSLESNGRFVMADAMTRWCQGKPTQLSELEVMLRSLPLALWLRGPNERIALATVRLTEALGADAITCLTSAVACQWLRNLFAKRTNEDGWHQTLQDMDAVTEFLKTDPALWQEVRAMLEYPRAEEHPATLALRQTIDALLAGSSLVSMLAHMEARGATEQAQILGRCAGGIVHGWNEVPDSQTTRELPDECRTWLTRLGERGAQLYRLERWPPETSTTHPLPLTTILLESGGRIILSSAPGIQQGSGYALSTAQRDLGMDIQRIVDAGIHHVVCLMAADELIDGRMENLSPWLEAHDIHLIHLPQVDGTQSAWLLEECERAMRELVVGLAQEQSVLIHGAALDDQRAQRFASQLLCKAQPALSAEDARRQVEVAVELALIDFQRHDQDE